jgi:hypothetical protein
VHPEVRGPAVKTMGRAAVPETVAVEAAVAAPAIFGIRLKHQCLQLTAGLLALAARAVRAVRAAPGASSSITKE